MKWIFHSIPQEGEVGNETWENDSWKVTGAANVWTLMSADPELGYVYLPFGTPSNDFYGGQRLGDNLFATSIVCLDAETGELVWYFQTTHHEVWDYDLPAAPNLVDITVDGRDIKALAQVSKQGFVYVLDRVTGEPVWPIEERPVPASSVPGERTAETQPFPTRPAAFELQGVSEDDLIDFTPELREEALAIINQYEYGPLFTPPSLVGTIQIPGDGGGAEWTGAALDPETSILYIPSWTRPAVIQVVSTESFDTEFTYVKNGLPSTLNGPEGLPLMKPPYGRISAVNLNTGEYEWVVPNGEGLRQRIIDKGIADPGPVGAMTMVTILATKSLLFTVLTDGVPMLKALDKATGETLHEVALPAFPQGSPMTYMIDGKQYISIASGAGGDASLVTLALP
jgi:quinoprotein glucose dehydrogenase